MRLLFVCCLMFSWFELGCTHWGYEKVRDEPREVGRRLLGSPHVVKTQASSVSGGFSGQMHGVRQGRQSSWSSLGSLSGQHYSVQRTHCVQKAKLSIEQPYRLVPVHIARPLDILVSVGLMIGGGGFFLAGAMISMESSHPKDSIFYHPPQDGTWAYVTGGAVVAVGVTWMVLSFALFPRGKKPRTLQRIQRWTEMKFVEAKGCGLPGDRQRRGQAKKQLSPRVDGRAKHNQEISTRLKKLQDLRKQGLIEKQEYDQKRKKLLDEL